MIETQVVQEQAIPIILLELEWDISSHVVVYFCKILYGCSVRCSRSCDQWLLATNRDEETGRAIGPRESVGKQLQPCIVSKHD